MIQITTVIYEYMQSHRRLTIPGLGSILSRGDGSPMIFSEFAKSDDGVLRGELVKRGVAEVRAASEIESFVEQTLQALSEEGGVVYLDGVGELVARPGGGVMLEGGHTSAIIEPDPKVEVDTPEEVEPEEVKLEPESDPEPEEEEAFDEEEFELEDYVESPYANLKRKTKVDPLIVFLVAAAITALVLFARGFVIGWSIGSVTLPEPIDNVMIKIFGDGFDDVETMDEFPVDEVE